MKMRGKRLLSMLLTMCMLFQVTAFSASADTGASAGRKPSGTEAASPSDAEKETDAEEETKEEVKEETKEEETESKEPESTNGVADDSKEEEETSDVSKPSEASQTTEPAPESKECICNEKCTEDSINEKCPVCGRDDALLADCQGEEGQLTIQLEDLIVVPDESDWDQQDGQELLDAYIEQIMYGNDGIALYGNFGEERLEGVDKKFYQKLKREVTAIAEGTRRNTEIEFTMEDLGVTKTSWTAADLGVSSLVVGNKINEEAVDKAAELCLPDLAVTLDLLLVNCPYELYWFDKTKGTGLAGLSFSYKNGTLTGPQKITCRMPVAKAYQDGSEYTVKGAKVNTAKAAAKNAQAIVSKHAGKDDYEKLDAYRAEICALVSYDYSAVSSSSVAFGDPWQLVHVFDGDKNTNVVCEGYAKAFQYLCDLSTFEDEKVISYIVVGDMEGATGEGPHMWNIVTMEDGKNYLVDITNCDDDSVGAEDLLFLAGTSQGSARNGYTFEPNGTWVTYTYATGQEDQFDLYGEGILTLADKSYKPKVAPKLSSYPAPKAVYGQTLKEVALQNPAGNTPGTWSWKNPETLVGNAGSRSFKADFTPADTNTYKTVKNVDITVTVSPKEVSNPAIILEAGPYDYNGRPVTPAVTVKDGNTVIPDSEYSVSYSNNINIGTATVTISNKSGGNYVLPDHKTVDFVIERINLSRAKIELGIPEGGYVYDKTEKTPSVTVKVREQAISTDWYTVSYSQNVNAGDGATVTVTAARDDICTGTGRITFTIANRPLVTVKVEDKIYDGTAEATVTAALDESKIISGDEVRLGEVTGAFSDRNPGTDKIVVVHANLIGKDAGNYEGTIQTTASIIPYEPVEVDEAIKRAKEAKEGVSVNNSVPAAVTQGTRFVSSEVLTAFEEAIKKAEAAKESPLTKEEAQAVAAELDQATEVFKEAIQTGTRKSGSGGGSGGSSGGGGGGGSVSGGSTSGGPSSGSPASAPTVTGTWIKNQNGWWLEKADKDYPKNQWAKINGSIYRFDANGYMVEGWLNLNNQWYYLIPGLGAMATNWIMDGGRWYFLNQDGTMAVNWVFDQSKWYYLNQDGAMATGWIQTGGKWYYLGADGAMYANTTTPDHYVVDENGAWVQ